MEWEQLDKGKVSKVIRRIRKEKGVTIEELADDHLGKSTISKIENGMEHVSREKIQYYVEEKLGTTLADIACKTMEEEQEKEIVDLKFMAIQGMVELVDPEEALQLLNELKHSPFVDDPEISAHLKYWEGRYHLKKRNWRRAEQLYRKVIRLADKKPAILGKLNLKARAYHELSRICFFKDDMQTALHYNQLAFQAYDEKWQRPNLKHVLSISKVMYLTELNRNAEALEELNTLWESMDEIENAEIILDMYNLKAELTKRLGMYREAVRYAKKGIEIAQVCRIPLCAYVLWRTLGSIYVEMGKIAEAETCFLMGFRYKKRIIEMRQNFVYYAIYKELGQLYIQQEQWAQAEKILTEGVRKGKNVIPPTRYNELLLTLGECYQKQKRAADAIEVFAQARQIAQDYQLTEQLKSIAMNMAACWQQLGNEQNFIANLIEFYNLETGVKSNKGGDKMYNYNRDPRTPPPPEVKK